MDMSPRDIGIVINVPFCTKVRKGEQARMAGCGAALRTAYLAALEQELMGAEDVLGDRRIKYLAVEGSAAMLPPDGLGRLLLKLRRSYDFAQDAEISIQMSPETVGTASLTGLNIAKFKRLCLDALSLDAEVLKTLGAGDLSAVYGALMLLGKFGYMRVSLRCIYGVPGMSAATIRRTLDLFTEGQQVKEIILFPYELAQSEGLSVESLCEQYVAAAAFLEKRGFLPYAPGRFARLDGRDGTLHAAMEGLESMGFGLGACSCMDGMRSQNTWDMSAYIVGASDYTRIVAAAWRIGAREKAVRQLLAGLACSEGISMEGALQKLLDEAPELGPAVSALEKQGLLRVEAGSLRVTALGCVCFSGIQKTLEDL